MKLKLKSFFLKLFNIDVECNLCGFRAMKLDSDEWHPYTICPNCFSQVRHRLFWAAVNLSGELNVEKIFMDKKILHFSPYYIISQKIRMFAEAYVTADLAAGGYNFLNMDFDMDITDMRQIVDASFDCLIAIDVLEHVKDHMKALEEINRVLSIGGYCILVVPQKDDLEITEEDPSIIDPSVREEKYGQPDHFRIYGLDFKQIIEEKGFEVSVITEKNFSRRKLKRHVLFPPVLSKNPAATNYRKVYFGRKVKECKKEEKN